jgi:exopolyphosphatase/guanosine-5'-triphosphate,3'-diphosphate pyrophosphatase
MRDARGGEQFRVRAAELLGVEPRVIGGDEEARLTFKGGLSGLNLAPTTEVVVFDIGGGSTEFIRGVASGRVAQAVSLDIGSVRLTERCVREDPVSIEDLSRLEATIAETLANNPVKAGPGVRVVGVAGTVTTLLAIANNVDPYDAKRVHGAELSTESAHRVFELLKRTPLEQRCLLPGLSPKRADVIVAGALLCARVLESLGAESMLVSDRGVRWGLADELSPA